jgi:hypothetical protein
MHCTRSGHSDSQTQASTLSISPSMPIKDSITHVPALAQWYPHIGSSEASTRSRLQPTEAQTLQNAEYERLHGLTRLYVPTVDPAFYYVKEGEVTLIVIEDPKLMATLPEDEMFAVLGQPNTAQEMASRIDKQATHYTYPEDGIAFSVMDGEAVLIELFAPMSLQAYLEEVYRKPGPRPL